MRPRQATSGTVAIPAVAQKPFYGWYIAITLALTETISWGILYYAFSVFLAPMESDLGWSRAELTGGFSLSLLIMGGMAFPVGAWIDKHGARVLMTAGSIAASLLVIAWSQVTSLPAFYMIWAGLGVCGAAVLYEPAFAVIAQWFQRRRGSALAVITFAAGLASTIFLPLSDALLHSLGWRTAILVLGLFLAAMTIPLHALILRFKPSTLGLLPDGAAPTVTSAATAATPGVTLREALRSRGFWLLTISFGLTALASSAIRVHLIQFLVGAGVAASTAAWTTGAIGITQVVGRIMFLPLDQRLSRQTLTIIVFVLQAISFGCLVIGQTPLFIGLFVLSFGAAQGAMTLTRPSLLAEQYGVTHYGRISSVMTIFLTLAGTSGPLGASLIYDSAGSYQPMLWLVLILAVISTVVMYKAIRVTPVEN